MQRKEWIDNLRGFCMLAILLDHTEIYYAGNNIIDYNLYVVNALIIFFILSGYLMYKPTGFCLKNKISSIFRTLLIPYFIFTTIIYIPKALAHGNRLDFLEMASTILTGQASWFVAALCVSELIFMVFLWTFKGKNIGIIAMSIIGFVTSIHLSTYNQPYFWQLDNAFQALLFLSVGYFYHKYEQVFNKINNLPCTSILFILLIAIKTYEHITHVELVVWHIHITNYPLFLIDTSICSLLMIQVFKTLPSQKWLSWTGKHSLVYYFLCGGIPLIISKIFIYSNITYHGNYLYVILAFILVYMTTTIITYLIYKYLPFITGKKYETRNKHIRHSSSI